MEMREEMMVEEITLEKKQKKTTEKKDGFYESSPQKEDFRKYRYFLLR